MKVRITQVLETIPKTSKAGKQYFVTTFQDENGKLYKDVFGKLDVGAEIEGEWKQTEWGEKFEITRQQGGGGRFNDPETRKEIIRQNALTNSVVYCTKKAELLLQLGAIKNEADLDKQLSGKHVVQVATHFAKYSLGEINVVTQNTDVAETMIKDAFPDAQSELDEPPF